MVDAHGHHVVDARLAAVEHHANDFVPEILGEGGLVASSAESGVQPFLGYLCRRQRGVPGETSEGIPVGLRKMVAAPVGVVADVGDACHRFQAPWLDKREELAPHGGEIDQVVGGAKILLGNLEFHHHLGLLQRGEQRTVGLAGLEVHGTVLDLDDDVVGKLSVEGNELLAGLVGAVVALRVIDKGTPHHDAVMRAQRFGEHVGAVGMGAAEVLRTWLAFGVGFHKESAEVGDEFVNLVHLVLPPTDDLGIEGVGCLQAAYLDGRGEVDGEIDANAIGA